MTVVPDTWLPPVSRGVAVLVVLAPLVSATLTGVVRRLALAQGLLDIPNQRSSHELPTPRGGGIAFVLTGSAGLVGLLLLGSIGTDLFASLLGGLVVAAVGLLDDRHSVNPGVRLSVQAIAALWAVCWLHGLPALQVGRSILAFGIAGYAVGIVAIVWSVNLFNFMDGIDGIAGSEAVFIAFGGAALTLMTGGSAPVADAALLVGAACCGFVLWNWPPARIFMGDVGSGYLGYMIAVVALAATRANPTALWGWLILSGVFFVDATTTLVRRLLRGERVYQAHRSHAYQWLARRWRSHRRTTLAVLLVNVAWLMPCALLATALPRQGAAIALCALTPLVLLVLWAGAGRSEDESGASTPGQPPSDRRVV